MKKSKLKSALTKMGASVSCVLLSAQVFADDKLAPVLNGTIKDMFGSSSTFWRLFILIDIIFAFGAWIKTKSLMTVLAVFVIILLPGVLIDTFVFGGVK